MKVIVGKEVRKLHRSNVIMCVDRYREEKYGKFKGSKYKFKFFDKE